MPIGFSFPFAPATGSLGYLEVTDDIASAISSNVRSLLVTNWGERVMHSDFGCNLREFFFEPKTRGLKASIADRVKTQLARWMPFLGLKKLFITFSEDDPNIPENSFHIHLELSYGNVPIDVEMLFRG